MLTIVVPGPDETEMFDEKSQEFINQGDMSINLEHSLISLSKWECIYEKPFLSSKDKTSEDVLSYIKCMCITRNVPEELFLRLSEDNITEIKEYIDAKMTATWFNEALGAPKSREVTTAELIYYWMIVFQIPFECEKWHLNRLFTLIRVCNNKQEKPKKMSRSELNARNRELNARRREELKTTG